MAVILVFFCLIANWPFWPRFQARNSKEYLTLNEAKRANLQSNKRILKWQPFWYKVYYLISNKLSKYMYDQNCTVTNLKLIVKL